MRHFALGALLTFAVPLASELAARAETPTEAGKRAFAAGVVLMQDPDGAKYDDALGEFRKAYQLLNNWKILGNVGLCALELERDGEAIDAYQNYLQAGAQQLEASEREQVQRDLTRLRSQVVAAHFESAVVPATLIDERVNAKGKLLRNEYPLASAALDLGLHPGHHVVTVRSAQGETRFVADLASGGKIAHKFDAPPKQAAPLLADGRTQRTVAIAAGGAGVVALGVGAWLGISAKERYGESDSFCHGGGNVRDAQGIAIAEDARSRGNVATIVLGAGAVAAVAGAVLWFTAPPLAGKETAGERIGVAVGPSSLLLERTW